MSGDSAKLDNFLVYFVIVNDYPQQLAIHVAPNIVVPWSLYITSNVVFNFFCKNCSPMNVVTKCSVP